MKYEIIETLLNIEFKMILKIDKTIHICTLYIYMFIFLIKIV